MTIARQEKIASRKRRADRSDVRRYALASQHSFRGTLSAHLAEVSEGAATGFRHATRECRTTRLAPQSMRSLPAPQLLMLPPPQAF